VERGFICSGAIFGPLGAGGEPKLRAPLCWWRANGGKSFRGRATLARPVHFVGSSRVESTSGAKVAHQCQLFLRLADLNSTLGPSALSTHECSSSFCLSRAASSSNLSEFHTFPQRAGPTNCEPPASKGARPSGAAGRLTNQPVCCSGAASLLLDQLGAAKGEPKWSHNVAPLSVPLDQRAAKRPSWSAFLWLQVMPPQSSWSHVRPCPFQLVGWADKWLAATNLLTGRFNWLTRSGRFKQMICRLAVLLSVCSVCVCTESGQADGRSVHAPHRQTAVRTHLLLGGSSVQWNHRKTV